MAIPKHLAIIMDGNGRWAQRRGYPRFFGHIRGASRVNEIVREADALGIKALTLYAFSTENWSRRPEELNLLWRLMKKKVLRDQAELHRQNVRLRFLGELDRLDTELQEIIRAAVDKMSGNTGLQLSFAVSYGSRKELTRAAALFAEDCVKGKRKPGEMSEELMTRYLWTAELGRYSDVDLVIRTSGEIRVSNFLLWQSAYAEYAFTDVCWPDFRASHLRQALSEYAERERRFGAVPEAMIQAREQDQRYGNEANA